MNKFLLLLTAASFLFACGTTNQNLVILKPADITVSKDIKSIAIINRTAPQNQASNIIEGFLTGEGIGQDRRAADEVIRGLYLRLTDFKKYTIVNTGERLVGSGSGHVFPNPLSWSEIEILCKKYNTDAILSLETFDTDAGFSNTQRNVNQKDNKGNTIVQTLFRTTVNVKVALGFRLYYPAQKSIYDQQQYNFQRSWWKEARTPQEASGALISRTDAILQTSSYAGDMYARKINPYFITVGRMYFKTAKGDATFKSASRWARIQNWTEAQRSWNQAMQSNPNPKVQMRGLYNLALVEEIQGNLEEALRLVDKSYALGNRKALRYSQVLRNRIYDQQRLNDQLGE